MNIWKIMSIMLGIMVFLEILGFGLVSSGEILPNLGLDISSNDIGSSGVDIRNSPWAVIIVGSLLVGLGSAIAIGFLTKTFDRKLVVLPFFTANLVLFLGFAAALFQIVKDTQPWLIGIVITVWGLISASFVLAMVKWWGD